MNACSSVREAKERAADVIQRLGLGAKRDQMAAQLTLPERKRLEVARALATGPRILLLDEVMAGLRPTETDHMVAFFRELNARLGLTILLIEHVMRAVMALSTASSSCITAKVIAAGTPDQGHARSSGARMPTWARRPCDAFPDRCQRDPERLRGRAGFHDGLLPALCPGYFAQHGMTTAAHGDDPVEVEGSICSTATHRRSTASRIGASEGELVAIVGANGAGKSSLIRTIAGIERPRAGRIFFRGLDITGLPSYRICNLGIGQVAEGRQIFPSLTVEENLQVGAMLPRARGSMAETLREVFALFPRLGGAATARQPAPCRAASSRCWRSAAVSWASRI